DAAELERLVAALVEEKLATPAQVEAARDGADGPAVQNLARGALLADRWANEGFASLYARRAADA
ncbi:MAG: hypothetical protein HGA90_05845, partial [Alphaproteobacteria bacterium]|nr:hypothetical protein [Alphaproteobacteria bacterium]